MSQFWGPLQKDLEDFERQRNEQDASFKSSSDTWGQAVKALEAAYADKLKLAQPAQYWLGLEDLYVKHGRAWVKGSVFVVLALAIFVS